MSGTPLSNYLRMLREQNGYTQDHVAKFLGVSRANYSHYENDRITPSSDSLCKLADLYDVPLTKLVRLAGSGYEVPDDTDYSHYESILEEGGVYDKYYNDFLKECANIMPNEIGKWLSLEDRELVYYFHNISERDKRLITYMIKAMLADKEKSGKD